MALQIITKSTDQDLTTTGALKALIFGPAATSTAYDVQLSALIRAGTRAFESYVGYPATVQSYRETAAGYGRRRMLLSRQPLVSVDAVYEATDTGTVAALLTSNGDYKIEDADAGILSRDMGWSWSASLQYRSARNSFGVVGGDAIPLNPEPVPGDEYRPYLVDYKAGWTYVGVDTGSANWSTAGGSTSTGRSLPEDIEQGVLLWAQTQYVNPVGVTSEKLGDIEVSYNVRSAGDDDQISTPWGMLWGPYRKVS